MSKINGTITGHGEEECGTINCRGKKCGGGNHLVKSQQSTSQISSLVNTSSSNKSRIPSEIASLEMVQKYENTKEKIGVSQSLKDLKFHMTSSNLDKNSEQYKKLEEFFNREFTNRPSYIRNKDYFRDDEIIDKNKMYEAYSLTKKSGKNTTRNIDFTTASNSGKVGFHKSADGKDWYVNHYYSNLVACEDGEIKINIPYKGLSSTDTQLINTVLRDQWFKIELKGDCLIRGQTKIPLANGDQVNISKLIEEVSA